MRNTSSSESETFVKIFNFPKEEEVIPWINSHTVGFSVIKEYPEKRLFTPAQTKEGKLDSVALIKVGYDKSNTKEISLRVNIHKVSRYLLNNHWDFNFEDKESPTEESLKESKASRQPIDLIELSRYIFHLDTQKIFDLEKNSYIDPKKIIDDIYKTHLETLRDIPFRIKMAIKNNSFGFIEPTNKFLMWVNFFFFGKQLKEDPKIFRGVFQTYPHENLISLSTEKIKILGSDFPITNQTARTFVFLIAILFLIDYYFKFDIFGFIALAKTSAKNTLFLTSSTATLLIVFDRSVPHVTLSFINLLIKSRLRVWEWKVSIKSASSEAL